MLAACTVKIVSINLMFLHFIKKNFLNKEAWIQLFRYGSIGVFRSGLGFTIYIIITHYFKIDPKIVISFLWIISMVIGFKFNQRWTFQQSEKSITSVIRFCLVYFTGYIFNIAALYIFVDIYQYSHQLTQLCSMIFLMFFFFFALKFFVFRLKL